MIHFSVRASGPCCFVTKERHTVWNEMYVKLLIMYSVYTHRSRIIITYARAISSVGVKSYLKHEELGL